MSWFATCFSCSSPSEPVEADGATDDVVADVRPLGDAGHYLDTGLDVRPPMPPCEAGAPRDTPALPSSLWDPIPGLDPCCGDRIAKDPDLVDPPFKWELCTSGKCEKLVGSNKRGSGGTYDTWIKEPLRYSEGAQILSYSRLELDVPTANIGRVVAVVQTLSPVPKRLVATAWDLEAGEACGPGPYWGPRGSVLTAPALTLSPGYLAFAPSGRYRAADLEVAKLPIYSGKSPIIPAVSAMAAFFEVGSPDYTTVSLNLTTRVFTPQPRSIGIGELLAFGDGALGRRWEPGDFFASGLGYIGPDGSGAPLLKASTSRYVFGTAVDRKQGEAIAWIEAADVGGVSGAVEMWTAPFALPPAAPQKRLVMKDPQSSGYDYVLMVAHDGLALFVRKRSQAHLVRLSDGMGWILSPEPGTDFTRPVGITDEHVMLFTAKQTCPTCSVQRQDSMIRFARASLGPPTEPNGL